MTKNQSTSNIRINPSKPIPRELRIKGIANLFYNFAFCPRKVGQQTEPFFHKCYRYFATLLYIIFAIKCSAITYIYITMSEEEIEEIKSNQRIFVYLWDFTYPLPQIRIHWNTMYLIVATHSILTQILNSSLSKNMEQNYSWLQLFLMMQGEVTPSSLGLFQVDAIKRLLRR